MDTKKRMEELVIDNRELAYVLINILKEPVIQHKYKEKNPEELINLNKELSEELIDTHQELVCQIERKMKQVTGLSIANKELAFQNEEKAKRAEELLLANKELAFQNEEKAKRAAELLIANKELVFQNEEKAKRAAELIIAKTELAFQTELAIANKELAFQFEEKLKRAEELLITNNKLNQLLQLNADKDLFISILVHDLRSPFGNILGLSEILKESIYKLDINEIEDIANSINESAQNSYKLLEDILIWAGIQQGQITFKPQILYFRDICNNILDILLPNAITKNITINYSFIEGITVYADINMLKTVLRNLVSNAIKFTNKNGVININAEQIDSNTTISVSDNGIGIAPDDLKKLFDNSEVNVTKGTAGETGTGLGLLLCKEFIEKHGASICGESVVGKGSRFSFTLPNNSDRDEVNVVE
jgi:signal transduction histidine kinase